ncbi:MAG: amidohydrolase family protein [Hydrogenovibrio sp.]|uniref:amidohydrolase family protein n=1 Tax=Hydrogenovibrio sp. TaxID=2065821 RepID=UPI00286FEC75|nr:amidohydrolase family protein [Hydrogenovibrio sp.]MDR9499970.1 amidohydrolase family protein [Hydrogenovibrio sp.]
MQRKPTFLSGAWLSTLLLLSASPLWAQAPLPPLFDSHSHYSKSDAERFTPEDIANKYERLNIIGAMISSTPTEKTEALHQAMPDRIAPFLSLYPNRAHKPVWMQRLSTLEDIEAKLDRFPYQGIGEFHIFRQEAYSPVLERVVRIAEERNLSLQIHGDATIINRVYQLAPDLTVIWAHLGTVPVPEYLDRVLARHPNLYIDTSVRDKLFTDEHGQLRPKWRDFFIKNQDRLLAAVDTYSTQRWERLDQAVANIRQWLNQLPEPARSKLAWQNGLDVYNMPIKPPITE